MALEHCRFRHPGSPSIVLSYSRHHSSVGPRDARRRVKRSANCHALFQILPRSSSVSKTLHSSRIRLTRLEDEFVMLDKRSTGRQESRASARSDLNSHAFNVLKLLSLTCTAASPWLSHVNPILWRFDPLIVRLLSSASQRSTLANSIQVSSPGLRIDKRYHRTVCWWKDIHHGAGEGICKVGQTYTRPLSI